MITVLSVPHIIRNSVRIYLDDQGFGDIELVENTGTWWNLLKDGEIIGGVTYDEEHITIKMKS